MSKAENGANWIWSLKEWERNPDEQPKMSRDSHHFARLDTSILCFHHDWSIWSDLKRNPNETKRNEMMQMWSRELNERNIVNRVLRPIRTEQDWWGRSQLFRCKLLTMPRLVHRRLHYFLFINPINTIRKCCVNPKNLVMMFCLSKGIGDEPQKNSSVCLMIKESAHTSIIGLHSKVIRIEREQVDQGSVLPTQLELIDHMFTNWAEFCCCMWSCHYESFDIASVE